MMTLFIHRFSAIIVTFILLFIPLVSVAETEHRIHFENTDYELHVYKVNGEEEGKTLMIIGGIQGDEPGGYLAADLYADIDLRKGNLIVVPRANFLSIIKNRREINRDMNRRFLNKKSRKYYEDKVVEILEGLIAKSDYLLNLHEGSGFYSDRWESIMVNPMRYGQSIIADADIYRMRDGSKIHIGNMARRVAENVNRDISDSKYHFRFNNHQTFTKDTKHAEQRRSATYFALSKHHIPAFGIETSKEIDDLEMKVGFQRKIINGFMAEFGIIPESEKVKIASPKLEYLLVSLNGVERLVHNGDELRIGRGDRFKVVGVNANYSRGLSVDLVGLGSAHDLEEEFVIRRRTRVVVKKDSTKCGEVYIVPDDNLVAAEDGRGLPSADTSFRYLVVENNGVKHVLKDGEHLKVVRGDLLRLLDVVGGRAGGEKPKVNFLGFVGSKLRNSGEDLGYTIDTSRGLWVKYSKGQKGKNYRVKISNVTGPIGSVYVDIEEPKMDYIVVKHNNGKKQWYASRDVIALPPGESFKVIDVKTNVAGNSRVKLYFQDSLSKGKGRRSKAVNVGSDIPGKYYKGAEGTEYKLVVKREGMVLGQTTVRVRGELASLF